MNSSTTKTFFITLGSVLFLFAVWEIGAHYVGQEILLPSPQKTFIHLISIFVSPSFWSTIGATIARGIMGFAISLVIAVFLGLVAGFYRPFFWLLQPWVTVIKTTPVMSIVILAIIWFETDAVPVFVAFLIIFPIIYGNVVMGIRNVDRPLLEMARMYKVKTRRIVIELFTPSIMPYLLAGVSTAMGLTWKVIIAAEILSQPSFAIGTELMKGKINFETANVFAWTVVAIMISFIFESFIQFLEIRLNRWGSSL
ncbi:MAG: ABC transporter permease subunit [Bacillota bacterium]|nr:ABC transporter permease subunit [Bacillota bacterium]